MNYKQKYLKYKFKYLNLKGGSHIPQPPNYKKEQTTSPYIRKKTYDNDATENKRDNEKEDLAEQLDDDDDEWSSDYIKIFEKNYKKKEDYPIKNKLIPYPDKPYIWSDIVIYEFYKKNKHHSMIKEIVEDIRNGFIIPETTLGQQLEAIHNSMLTQLEKKRGLIESGSL